jgi:ABC-2 type transport system ATP-binding protein
MQNCPPPQGRPDRQGTSTFMPSSVAKGALTATAVDSNWPVIHMIECQGLTKQYGRLLAVDDLSFKVSPGEVLGFLGPNGAGKTTTMRIVAGFLPATAGRALVCGYDVETHGIDAKRRIGYLPEGAPSYPEMTPRAFLEFVADARGLPAPTRRRRLEEVYEQLHLEKVLEQSIDTLSKGYRRRVGLAQAILHDPDVLLLDEPTDGLDPNQKHEVRQLIGNMAANKIIVISTHLLEEVDAICTRAVVIAHGKILADDTPQGLEARSRFHNAVSLKLGDPSQLAAARAAIEGLPDVAATELDPKSGRLTAFPAPGRLPLAPINALADRSGWDLTELHLESGRLDEVFRSITGGASA